MISKIGHNFIRRTFKNDIPKKFYVKNKEEKIVIWNIVFQNKTDKVMAYLINHCLEIKKCLIDLCKQLPPLFCHRQNFSPDPVRPG